MPVSPDHPVSEYNSADNHVWQILFERQLPSVRRYAYAHFCPGLDLLGFSEDFIPDFAETNRRLRKLNGWSVYPVPGLISNADFFREMAGRKFGVTSWIRPLKLLDYLEEPDLFHDVFGHVPLLTDPRVVEFLLGLAELALRHIGEDAVIEAIARLYWYTVEFGLVRERGSLKICGAGILSSIGETKFVMSDAANHVPFDVARILETPYIKDKFQEQYFVLDSMEQLPAALDALASRFRAASS